MVSMEMIRKGWIETVMKAKPTPETEPLLGPPPPAGSPAPLPPPWAAGMPACVS